MNNQGKTDVTALRPTHHLVQAFALLALGVGIGALATAASSASAFGGGAGMRGCDSEQHEAVREALESKDYDAWKELVAGRPIADRITEGNFDTFVELHEAMEARDWEKASELRETLGFGAGFHHGHGGRGWRHARTLQ